MSRDKHQVLRLHPNDIGQILDGLRCRAESWRETAQFLESGHAPRDDFIAEECSKPIEAAGIARHYERIIRDVEKQLTANDAAKIRKTRSPRKETRPKTGFCIFTEMFFQGSVLAVRDGDELPCVFATEREAQAEIANFWITRLQEFIDGERDFEDVAKIDEYVVPVTVFRDGSIAGPDGRKFGRDDD